MVKDTIPIRPPHLKHVATLPC